MNNEILSKVKEYIGNTFREKGSSDRYYHNFTHTAEVAKVTEEIADSISINVSHKEALIVAAWLHHIRDTDRCEEHEDVEFDLELKY